MDDNARQALAQYYYQMAYEKLTPWGKQKIDSIVQKRENVIASIPNAPIPEYERRISTEIDNLKRENAELWTENQELRMELQEIRESFNLPS